MKRKKRDPTGTTCLSDIRSFFPKSPPKVAKRDEADARRNPRQPIRVPILAEMKKRVVMSKTNATKQQKTVKDVLRDKRRSALVVSKLPMKPPSPKLVEKFEKLLSTDSSKTLGEKKLSDNAVGNKCPFRRVPIVNALNCGKKCVTREETTPMSRKSEDPLISETAVVPMKTDSEETAPVSEQTSGTERKIKVRLISNETPVVEPAAPVPMETDQNEDLDDPFLDDDDDDDDLPVISLERQRESSMERRDVDAVCEDRSSSLDQLLESTYKNETLASMKSEILNDQFGDRIKRGANEDDDKEAPPDLSANDQANLDKLMVHANESQLEIPGERSFNGGPPMPLRCPMPRFSGPLDAMQTFLQSITDEDVLRAAVGFDAIHLIYLKVICPDQVAQWLFKYMCSQSNVDIVMCCFKSLLSWMKIGKEEPDCGTQWFPSVLVVSGVLASYGMTLESALPERLVDADATIRRFRGKILETFVAKVEPVGSDGVIPVFAFSKMLEIVALSIDLRPDVYTVEDVFGFLAVIARCSLDKRTVSLQCSVQTLVTSCLDWFLEEDWFAKAKELCVLFGCLSDNHRNLLQLATNLPAGQRGVDFQKLFSYSLLCRFQPEKRNVPFEKVGLSLKISYLIPFVDALELNSDSDYGLINTLINLLDFCVGNEAPKREEISDLTRLFGLLRSRVGEIKDKTGRDVARGKTKDFIYRLLLKYDAFIRFRRSSQSTIRDYLNLGDRA